MGAQCAELSVWEGMTFWTGSGPPLHTCCRGVMAVTHVTSWGLGGFPQQHGT